jgi:hypothetical protein
MKTRTRQRSLVIAAAVTTMLLPATAFAAGTVQVNESSLGVSWVLATLGTGQGAFRAGPADPPLGTGSFEMDTFDTNVDKVTLVTSDWTGRLLSELTALDYWTYRDATSTSPSFVAPSINIAIYTNVSGPATGFATLVFEPLYSYGNGAIHDGIWQRWDTLAPSVTGFAGGWWTTRVVGSTCAFSCYATLATLQAEAPNATILWVGLNVGRGPASFIGAVDGLSLIMAGATTTYDFDQLQADKDGCKDGGWLDFHTSDYRNQGDCVSFFASARRQGPKPTETAAATEHRADRGAASTTNGHADVASDRAKSAPIAASTTRHRGRPIGK